MKIVYVIGYIHGWGGIERVLAGKANYLVNQGHEVSFVKIYKNHEKPYFHFDERIKFHELNFDFDEQKGLSKKLKFNQNKNQFVQKINDLFHEIKPDISISTFCKYSKFIYKCDDGSKKIIERHFAKYKRNQIFVKTDKLPFGKSISYLYRWSDYNVVKHFDKFVVLTEEDKNDWGDLKNIVAIPNPITFVPKSFSNCEHKRAIAMGRISKQKQYDVMLRIWQKVVEKNPDWSLVVFANGGKPEKLKKLAIELKIEANFEVYPTTRDVEKELINSSLYLMTSKYEGFPLVLLEAMSCGLPPVSFACKCGPKDMITNGLDGFLVEPGDESNFVNKINFLIENESKRKEMGQNAAKSIQRFSEEKVMKKWNGLFLELTN